MATNKYLIFLNGKIANWQSFLEPSIIEQISTDAEVVVLNPSQDTLTQIASVVVTHHGLQSLHLISPSQNEQFNLGGNIIDSNALQTYFSPLTSTASLFSAPPALQIHGRDSTGATTHQSLPLDLHPNTATNPVPQTAETNLSHTETQAIPQLEAPFDAIRHNALPTSPTAETAPAEYATDRIIVKFKPMTDQASIMSAVDTMDTLGMSLDIASSKTIGLTGAQVWKLSGNMSVEKAVAKYQASGLFEYVEPDYIIHVDSASNPATNPASITPNDPDFSSLWGLNNTGQSGGTVDADIDATEAWQIQTGNPNFVVGVIDTGIDYTHPDLIDNIWTNPGELINGVYVEDGIDNDGNGYIDDIHGWDFAYNDNKPTDVYGHGTHVAGTIAAKGNNATGVTGVAWNAKVMALKFLDDSGYGSISDAIDAINYATMMGVKVTNNSWGGGGFSQALVNAIDAAGQQGALFIAAAGNGGSDGVGDNNDLTPFYPSSYNSSNIISVAATDHNDHITYFSNYGASSVDLAAPGKDIYSTLPGVGYGYKSGTSMATPHVTGAVALLWSQHPDWTAQQIKDALLQTTDTVFDLIGQTVSGGRLNVNNALQYDPTLPNTNHAPSISTCGVMPTFYENGSAIVIDTSIHVKDNELAANRNYNGAYISISRHEGANAEDKFSASGNLIFNGNNLLLSGVNIGTVRSSKGMLVILFNAGATQSRVDEALSSIVYANTSDTPPASIQLDWIFSDGNKGQQGAGGNLTGSITTTLNIAAVNDAPILTFLPSGIVTTAFGANASVFSSTLQADGKILVGGEADFTVIGQPFDIRFALARYNSDGSLDANFDGDGKVTTLIGSHGSVISSIKVQSDSKILAAGISYDAHSNPSFTLARYNNDGSLDTSFDFDGIATTSVGMNPGFTVLDNDPFMDMTIQKDGKILVVGKSYNGTDYNVAIVRYNNDGSLDNSFDGDGIVITDDAGNHDFGHAVLQQTDNKIVVAGTKVTKEGEESFALQRYTSDGSLDTGFGIDGKVTTKIGIGGALLTGATLQADGKILVTGHAHVNAPYNDFVLVRYNSDGSLDNSFSNDGIVSTDIVHWLSNAYSLTLQADGKILVAGEVYRTDGDFALVRYNSDGSLDTSFDGDGIVVTSITLNDGSALRRGAEDRGYSVALQEDGKIVVSGTSNEKDAGGKFTLVRYNSDGSLDTTFNQPHYTENGVPVVLSPNIKISDVELITTGNYGGTSLTLSRHTGPSTQDLFSNTGTLGSLTQNSVLVVDGTSIGTVTTNSNGTLILTFNDNATQSLVNSTLQQISYSNTSDAPPASVQIDWLFSDGNTGAQGLGGALTAIGSSTVHIITANDAPTDLNINTSNINENVPAGSVIGTLSSTDPNIGDTFTYSLVTGTGDTDNSAFSIVGSQLKINSSPDFKTKSIYNILVRTTDQGRLFFDKALTIDISNVNDAPMGNVSVNGTALLNQVLTASHTLTDEDGMGSVGYQWQSSTDGSTWNDINGATASTLKLTSAQIAKQIRVMVSYADGSGTLESISSDATQAVGILLIGNSSANIMSGTAGADRFEGLAGNDTYIVDHRFDTVIENVAAGTDLVQASVDFTLSANLERLTLTGTANINGIGNELANIITGNSGNNILDGGAGADKLIGGAGNDTYIVDIKVGGGLEDKTITEKASAGIDTLMLRGTSTNATATTITLAANLENLDASASGSSKLNLTGNAVNNTLIGNDFNNKISGASGNDILVGGAGNDTLDGGTGSDTYVLKPVDTSANGGLGLDVITKGDFVTDKDSILDAGEDILDLSGMFADGAVDVSNLSQYLQMNGTTLQTDRDGSGSNYTFTNLVTITGTTLTNNHLDELLTAGQIIV